MVTLLRWTSNQGNIGIWKKKLKIVKENNPVVKVENLFTISYEKWLRAQLSAIVPKKTDAPVSPIAIL